MFDRSVCLTSVMASSSTSFTAIIEVKLTKISYVGTLFKVRLIQGTGLFRFWLIQGTGLFRFRLIQGTSLFRVWLIQGTGLFRVQLIQGTSLFRVWLIQGTSLFRVRFRQVSLYIIFPYKNLTTQEAVYYNFIKI
jgi:hypothetical protein